MDIKSGDYVKYKSNEYRAIRRGNEIEIISNKSEDRFKGFIKDDDIYYKVVSSEEIEAANKVQTMAKYKGRDFLLFSRNEKISLITSGDVNDKELLDLGFNQFNKGEYKLENLQLDQLDKIWDERSPIWQDLIKNKGS
jgi:hypothetical protein